MRRRPGWVAEPHGAMAPKQAVNLGGAAIKELTAPNDVRVISAYEEAHKNRQRIVLAAQTRVAAIAQELVGIN